MGYGGRFEFGDFEWVALDARGQAGLFAADLGSEIPAAVQREFLAYDALAQEFALPNEGSVAVWQDYARYGLYVYHWQEGGGPYARVAVPLAPLSAALRAQILALPGLLRLPVVFAEAEQIVVVE